MSDSRERISEPALAPKRWLLTEVIPLLASLYGDAEVSEPRRLLLRDRRHSVTGDDGADVLLEVDLVVTGIKPVELRSSASRSHHLF